MTNLLPSRQIAAQCVGVFAGEVVFKVSNGFKDLPANLARKLADPVVLRDRVAPQIPVVAKFNLAHLAPVLLVDVES